MAQEFGVWGIDLGQCALKALRLQNVGGTLTATAFDYVEHPKILSQPDADPDALTHEALEKFLSRNSLRGDLVAISVPGQSGLARFVKLPPVEEKKIGDIVKFEAKQQIPFSLDEVVWDYQKIGSGIVTDGFAMETEIGLFAMKRDMIAKYMQHFKDVNVEVHLVQMAPLALCNYVAYDLLGKGAPSDADEASMGLKKSVVALDIGADSSNLVITDGERIIWQRPIPLGGNHFTRALTKDLKLTFAKAEHLKRNATKSPDLKKILAALKPVLNDFVGEVQRSLGYFTNTHRDAQIEYMVGLGNAFRLPGLQRFLAEKLQLEVRKLAKLERLSGEALNAPTYVENILGFGVAYGLALQGIKNARLVTNLLPGEIRLDRMVRAKKPWAATAAACLLFGSGMMMVDAYLNWRSYAEEGVVKAEKDADAAAKKVSDAEAAFTKARNDALAEERAVRAIVAGQSEQRNWLKIMKFVGDIIPRPDGTNFPDVTKPLYWTRVFKERETKGGLSGAQAYANFQRRQMGRAGGVNEAGVRVDGDELGRGIDDLILYNIERVDCMYTDDLKGYWTNVRQQMPNKEPGQMRPQSQWDKPPEGQGWVVELQGFTYHHRGPIFVIEGLVENIARVGVPPEAAPAAAPAGGAAPATGATAAAKPAAPAAGATAGKPDLAALEAATKEPIKISHVVLFDAEVHGVSGASAVGPLTIGPVLSSLVKGGGAAGGGAPVGGMPPVGMPNMGPGGPTGTAPAASSSGLSRDGWSSLLGAASGSGGFGGPAGGGGAGREGGGPTVGGAAMGMRSGGRRGGGGGEGGGGGGGAARTGPTSRPGGGQTGGNTAVAEGQHQRTEFTVLFVWQEPTPSDLLREDAKRK